MQPIPGVAWVPLAIIWFGLGNQAAIFIIAMGSVFPLLVSTVQGVREVDPNLVNAALTMGASGWQVLNTVVFPSMIPSLLTGARVGLSFAWRVLLAAEMVGVPEGLGFMLNLGRGTGRTEVTMLTILSLGIIMLVFDHTIFTPIENFTRLWRQDVKG